MYGANATIGWSCTIQSGVSTSDRQQLCVWSYLTFGCPTDNHFPYMPFPEMWPVFTPKDRLADWLEVYAQALNLDIWTSTTVREATWNGDRWEVKISRKMPNGTFALRTVRPRHIVQATGQAGRANLPKIEGMYTFQGSRLCHSSEFPGVQNVAGNNKEILVIGSGTSAHDIAESQQLQRHHCSTISYLRWPSSRTRSNACLQGNEPIKA